MNTYNLTLSSSDTDYTSIVPTLYLDDHTKLILNVSRLSEKVLPIFLKVDWGDGNDNIYDNDIYVQSRDKVNIFTISPVLTDTYFKEYYPSETSLYKSLTAQVLVDYSNGDKTWIKIPIRIRTYDYFESIYDMTLTNTNILPLSTNNKEHQVIIDAGGFLVELLS